MSSSRMCADISFLISLSIICYDENFHWIEMSDFRFSPTFSPSAALARCVWVNLIFQLRNVVNALVKLNFRLLWLFDDCQLLSLLLWWIIWSFYFVISIWFATIFLCLWFGATHATFSIAFAISFARWVNLLRLISFSYWLSFHYQWGALIWWTIDILLFTRYAREN